MNFKKLASALAVAAVAAVASVPAQAGYVVLDGWQLVTPVQTTTNIGRMNLVSGNAIVEQEVNGLGQAFVGAKFQESGQIFSLTYTSENTVGLGDSGAPGMFGELLQISFSSVAGVVTNLNPGGGFHYTFTSGMFQITSGATTYATGSIVGIGGNASSTSIIGGFTGDSTLLAAVLSTGIGVDFRDNTATSLLADMAAGDVLFQATTTNTLANVIGGGPCSFAPSNPVNGCVRLNVASAGDAYLVRAVPEPGTLALTGLALFAAASLTRRLSKKA